MRISDWSSGVCSSDLPAIVAVEADGHKERMVEAVAEMGGRFPGSRHATIREGVGCLPLFGPVFTRANMMPERSGATSLAELAADFRKLEASAEWHHIMIVADRPGGLTPAAHAIEPLATNSR